MSETGVKLAAALGILIVVLVVTSAVFTPLLDIQVNINIISNSESVTIEHITWRVSRVAGSSRTGATPHMLIVLGGGWTFCELDVPPGSNAICPDQTGVKFTSDQGNDFRSQDWRYLVSPTLPVDSMTIESWDAPSDYTQCPWTPADLKVTCSNDWRYNGLVYPSEAYDVSKLSISPYVPPRPNLHTGKWLVEAVKWAQAQGYVVDFAGHSAGAAVSAWFAQKYGTAVNSISLFALPICCGFASSIWQPEKIKSKALFIIGLNDGVVDPNAIRNYYDGVTVDKRKFELPVDHAGTITAAIPELNGLSTISAVSKWAGGALDVTAPSIAIHPAAVGSYLHAYIAMAPVTMTHLTFFSDAVSFGLRTVGLLMIFWPFIVLLGVAIAVAFTRDEYLLGVGIVAIVLSVVLVLGVVYLGTVPWVFGVSVA